MRVVTLARTVSSVTLCPVGESRVTPRYPFNSVPSVSLFN